MTPHVTVDFSPQSLAALAIGGVLVLGHSWESIEASKGWRENKKRSTSNEYLDAVTKTTDESGAASSNAATASNPKSQKKKTTTSYTKTTTQKVLTNDEREAAAASARADRVLAIAARRARLEMQNLGEGSSMGNQYDTKNKAQSITIEVCTNNQCAKRGGKELLAALQSLAERSEFSGDDGRDGDGNGKKIIEVKRSRCMDACAVACAVKVTGSGTVTRHDRCAGDEVSISHLPHSAD
jgi:NADH:ubiquinone oxidoreductase subunit E|tara:strand:+ start:2059 stop:2775 length:717 start_codon:yes stop_codon:yes gene_type:complete